MDYQWYPGHMTKARRAMQEDIRLIDLVIEILDARIPYASRNPDIDTLAAGKARIIVLAKEDLADPAANEAWKRYFESRGAIVICGDARGKGIARQMQPLIEKACEKKIARDRARGILNRPVRAMVCGIPNVGKSTLINSMAGRASAKTGNKPGVTRGRQWIRLKGQVELLDTPGLLWPRFEDQTVGMHLAMVGSIRDEIIERELLAAQLIALLQTRYPGCLEERYGLEADGAQHPSESTAESKVESAADHLLEETAQSAADHLLEETAQSAADAQSYAREMQLLRRIALQTGCLMRGQEADVQRCAARVIDDFRKGKLGKISLEIPNPTN